MLEHQHNITSITGGRTISHSLGSAKHDSPGFHIDGSGWDAVSHAQNGLHPFPFTSLGDAFDRAPDLAEIRLEVGSSQARLFSRDEDGRQLNGVVT